MPKLTLFSGAQCSLCDTAKSMLETLIQKQGSPDGSDALFDVTIIDVKAQREFFHQYGARIPVLKREDNQQELAWPFDSNQLIEFLK